MTKKCLIGQTPRGKFSIAAAAKLFSSNVLAKQSLPEVNVKNFFGIVFNAQGT